MGRGALAYFLVWSSPLPMAAESASSQRSMLAGVGFKFPRRPDLRTIVDVLFETRADWNLTLSSVSRYRP